jgi:hypothetical protein
LAGGNTQSQLEAMMSPLRKVQAHAVEVALLALVAAPVEAQLSTATIRGRVTQDNAAAPPNVSVVAINKDDGFQYATVTLKDGSYAVAGLPPGVYEIHVTGPQGTASSEQITLAVGESASVDLALTRREATGEALVVVGERRRAAVKDSEIGTNVAPAMVNGLPQTTRNFLSSVDLAPGVAFVQDPATGYTSVQSGGQNHDNVNVFIDGVSDKNNILRGGVSGQDSSRGNPFPQSAVKEFKVITQNYKAEYDQVSSAAISAVTKSGTNDFHGDVYFDRTESDWRAKTPFEIANAANGQPVLPSSQNEWGLDVGGPIVKDKIHFFLAYDGKDIGTSREVIPLHINELPAGVGITNFLASQAGSYVDSFTEHLLFGRMDAQLAENRKVTVTARLRLEQDLVPEDPVISGPGNDQNRNNNEFRVDALHSWNINSDWLSETRLGYQSAYWNPHSNVTSPEIRYKVSTLTPPTLTSGQDIILSGGSPNDQNRGQRGPTLSQDFTFSGLASHVFKGGAKISLLNYDLSGTARSVDVVQTVVDTTTGLPYYDPTTGNCLGTNIINNGADSTQCHIDRALAPAAVSMNNAQIGAYVQDDWDVTRRLQLNLGVRWDVETNMLNNHYVTPADRLAAIYGADTRTFNGETAAPGQTYAQSLALGGVNIADYITDGHQRSPYLLAFAPRLGASFDVFGNRNTVLFGGYGRSYDRTIANDALDELQNNMQPHGDIYLIRNSLTMPYTDQYSVGVRQAVWVLNLEAAWSEQDGKNQFQWFSGNRDLNGGYYQQSYVDPLFGGPAGYGNLVLGDFIGETRTRSFYLKAEKPYTKASGWGATAVYTYTDARTKHREWNDDIFDWTYGRNPGDRPWNPSRLIDKNRLIIAAFADNLLPAGFIVSAKFTYGSGLPRRVVGCPFVGDNPCSPANGGAIAQEEDTPEFKQIDLGIAKRFQAGPGAFVLRVDVFNIFNWYNYAYDTDPFGGVGVAPGKPANSLGLDNLMLDTPIAMRGPTRTVKMTGTYTF